MNERVRLVNEKILEGLGNTDEQMAVKRSLRTGQRVVLSYPLSSDVKKQITGIVIKKTNANKPYAILHSLCGDVKHERLEKSVNLFSPSVTIVNSFPSKKGKRADLRYLRYVNSLKSSI